MTEPLFRHPGFAKLTESFLERHVEEMDFLFDQRAVFFHDPHVPWATVERLDGRIRAHAAALSAWGDGALAWARGQLESSEAALPAAFVLASSGSEDDVKAAVLSLETAPPELVPRIVLGLGLARGLDPSAALSPLATSGSAAVRAAVAIVLGSRRGPTSVLEDLLHDDEPAVQVAAARALARTGARAAAPSLERKVAAAPEATGDLLWPLVELGSRAVAGACRLALSGKGTSTDAALALAITGEPSDAALLRASLPAPSAAHALGLLGAIPSIPWLLSMLATDDEEVRAVAGAALGRITGAGLTETVDLPAPADETAPRPALSRVERPSTSRVVWERWWHTHRTRFDERARYRGGAPFVVRAAVDELAAPLTPFADRRRAAAEIRFHTRTSVAFDPEGWISEQKQAIRDWQGL